MKNETLHQFMDILNQLSPEYLSGDGELTTREVRKRYRELMNQWRALEREVGKRVTEDEVYALTLTE